ncbi:malate synthase A [Actinobacteria bacterium YIM 96077]|uniref:Malate synthase n=1 Tax=Phytoactinopolyspora halophila TaxID=1981511 RepID=A0A329QY69_9ACTN|nr:malate synthase A [Phytoactinopolyspora halophila]AYY13869.1 malate synthase A [Actinobacteria bacterium YIM 96077]RAW15588.1 malate synthase A [Phytoactinopolyspora halophila]
MADVEVTGPAVDRGDEILTPQALEFIGALQRRFGARRDELLALRAKRRADVMENGTLDFLPETASIRSSSWQVAPAPQDLLDRRVEITGPTERKMAINALNSGAKVWLADLEDANTPHWSNVVAGQVNLYDAVRRTLYQADPGGKEYRLRDDAPLAVIVMRPRGWHLDERHILVDGAPVAGALVDFGLYFFHNARELLNRGSGPYFYLPKLESHLEARLWNDVFAFAQDELGIPQGTIRATVLIETIPAAFEMDEILYELREHASGLNAGRWDYLFSMIKYFRDAGSEFVLPDRNSVTMTAPFMRAYTELLVRTCHRRGAFAMGGMAAFIPSRRDAAVNERALAKVRADKEREAGDGFDGSWVAHPDLVPICEEAFGAVLGQRPNQVERTRDDVQVGAADLLDVAATPGSATEDGLRNNVSVALQYIASWLGGNGAAAINNLMEDAATAEIARAQIWQWVHNGVPLDGGPAVTAGLVRSVLDEELASIRSAYGDAFDEARFAQARDLFERVALADDFADFLTLPAYDLLD